MSEVDVLVVGGGPVGVTAALLAARRGLRARVLERATHVYQLPRAVVMDDEIQRVFLGSGWAVLAHDPAGVASAGALGGVLVTPLEGELAGLVAATGGVIVRPDRYVAAVPTGDELLAAALGLASIGGLVHTMSTGGTG